MADQSDVEVALAALIAGVLYPTGLSGDPPPSILGCPARVARGWPDAVALDADLRAGILNVTVYPRPGTERNTTRFTPQWQTASINPATFTLSQVGQVVTVGGAQPGTFYVQNVAIVIGAEAYLYKTTADDTADTIAAALGAEIEAAMGSTSVSGNQITLPPTAMVVALRVGATGAIVREVARQERQFQLTFWCFNPTIRDQACALVKPALDAAEFLTLADGRAARMYYGLSNETDAPQKEILYRRDLIYCVEWATLQSQTATQIVAIELSLTEGEPLGQGVTTTTNS